jgi:hypothetical protein
LFNFSVKRFFEIASQLHRRLTSEFHFTGENEAEGTFRVWLHTEPGGAGRVFRTELHRRVVVDPMQAKEWRHGCRSPMSGYGGLR